jgi:hypothetical protein
MQCGAGCSVEADERGVYSGLHAGSPHREKMCFAIGSMRRFRSIVQPIGYRGERKTIAGAVQHAVLDARSCALGGRV